MARVPQHQGRRQQRHDQQRHRCGGSPGDVEPPDRGAHTVMMPTGGEVALHDGEGQRRRRRPHQCRRPKNRKTSRPKQRQQRRCRPDQDDDQQRRPGRQHPFQGPQQWPGGCSRARVDGSHHRRQGQIGRGRKVVPDRRHKKDGRPEGARADRPQEGDQENHRQRSRRRFLAVQRRGDRGGGEALHLSTVRPSFHWPKCSTIFWRSAASGSRPWAAARLSER